MTVVGCGELYCHHIRRSPKKITGHLQLRNSHEHYDSFLGALKRTWWRLYGIRGLYCAYFLRCAKENLVKPLGMQSYIGVRKEACDACTVFRQNL